MSRTMGNLGSYEQTNLARCICLLDLKCQTELWSGLGDRRWEWGNETGRDSKGYRRLWSLISRERWLVAGTNEVAAE